LVDVAIVGKVDADGGWRRSAQHELAPAAERCGSQRFLS
jgi:hypothetical protein